MCMRKSRQSIPTNRRFPQKIDGDKDKQGGEKKGKKVTRMGKTQEEGVMHESCPRSQPGAQDCLAGSTAGHPPGFNVRDRLRLSVKTQKEQISLN